MDRHNTSPNSPSFAPRWWERASGVMRVSPRTTGRTLLDVVADLDSIAELGFDAIELFAPGHGGTTYEGLDVIDFTAIDPVLGTMDDFVMLVDECHRREMALIAFLNLGYVNDQYAPFLRACDDMRQNLLGYYATHPFAAMKRVYSTVVDGFCNKYLACAWRR
jgi:glycosidase